MNLYFLARCFCLLLLLLTAGSCNIAQAVDAVTRPDPEIKAKYEISDRTTVVIVDDPGSHVNPVRLRREIASSATEKLLQRRAISDMIDPRDAFQVARKLDKPGDPVSLDDIGRAVGASQLIYIEVIGFGIQQGPRGLQPRADLRVKLIDVDGRRRLFPADDGSGGSFGASVSVSVTQQELQSIGVDRLNEAQMELAKRSGVAVARLFVNTKYTPSGDPLLGQ
ncbi:MAG: hypothetical protein MK077_04830 [Phycisphaerales bacterium]|nr:hypothetical protein [Phycisphaerales bacterium]